MTPIRKKKKTRKRLFPRSGTEPRWLTNPAVHRRTTSTRASGLFFIFCSLNHFEVNNMYNLFACYQQNVLECRNRPILRKSLLAFEKCFEPLYFAAYYYHKCVKLPRVFLNGKKKNAAELYYSLYLCVFAYVPLGFISCLRVLFKIHTTNNVDIKPKANFPPNQSCPTETRLWAKLYFAIMERAANAFTETKLLENQDCSSTSTNL